MSAHMSEKKKPATGETVVGKKKGTAEDRAEKLKKAMAAREASGANSRVKIKTKPMKPRVSTKLSGWFRVHPEFTYEFDIFQMKIDGQPDPDPMFVTHDVVSMHAPEDPAFKTVAAYLAFTVNGSLILLVIPSDMGDGNVAPATQQKHEAAIGARTEWTRLTWLKSEFCYQIATADGIVKEPSWPENLDPIHILDQAFGDKMIWDYDHPMLQAYRGEAA